MVPTTTCPSGLQWAGGNRESGLMNPGAACIACHASGEGPLFVLAGTVYSSANEADNCGGVSTGLTIVITDANGAVTNLTPNDMGNFYLERATVALPFNAKVVNAAGMERAMAAAQMSGDCNTCHTQTGAQGAPGRIMAP
jgi:hypothetical protein